MSIDFRQPSAPERLEALAQGQHCLFSQAQAEALGVQAALIHRRCERGAWARVEPRVYRTAQFEPSWMQALHAACLGAGPAAVASHRAAAALWRFDGVDSAIVELSVPRESTYRRHTVHRVRDLAPVDMAAIDGIPTTTLARTLVDLGAVVDEVVLERALESALRQGLSLKRLRWRLDALAGRGRPGATALRRVLARRPEGAAPTESELETRFAQLLRDAGLPEPVRQHEVRDDGRLFARIDFAYPERRLAIELDGVGYHASTFQPDRSRQNRLVLLGWTVLRFTWADVVDRPGYVVRALTAALAA